MTSLWRNFSGNVVANSNWSCLLISASKVVEKCNRLLPDGAADSSRRAARGSGGCACIAWVTSHNTASLRTVHKRFKRNSNNKSPNNSPKCECHREWRRYESVPGWINKAVPSFRNSLARVREGWGKTFWAFFSNQKSACAECIAETIFDNVSTAKVPWLKVAQFCQFCR